MKPTHQTSASPAPRPTFSCRLKANHLNFIRRIHEMADSAFMTTYRDEHITAFEQNFSLLRATCVQEAVIKGNQAVFLVSGSGGVSAVTRGVNGLIPYATVENTQYTCVLTEQHAPFERKSLRYLI
jgi:hypothetical protein